MKDTII